MTKQRAIRLAAKKAAGHVCTLREGEAQEYHELCLEALKRTQWISVKERLPENGKMALCKTAYFYEVLQWDDRIQGWCGAFNSHGKNYVTHWMPLPKPPEEVEK